MEFKISVFMGNDNPFNVLWTLLTARLFAREDGSTSLIGFNLSNSANNWTIERASAIRAALGFEDKVRFEHHITETYKSIVRQPYDRLDELVEIAQKVRNISAKHEGGVPGTEAQRAHPSDILDYFMARSDVEAKGLMPAMERNYLDKHESVQRTARALLAGRHPCPCGAGAPSLPEGVRGTAAVRRVWCFHSGWSIIPQKGVPRNEAQGDVIVRGGAPCPRPGRLRHRGRPRHRTHRLIHFPRLGQPGAFPGRRRPDHRPGRAGAHQRGGPPRHRHEKADCLRQAHYECRRLGDVGRAADRADERDHGERFLLPGPVLGGDSRRERAVALPRRGQGGGHERPPGAGHPPRAGGLAARIQRGG